MTTTRNLFAMLVAPQRPSYRLGKHESGDVPAPQCLNAISDVKRMLEALQFKSSSILARDHVVDSAELTSWLDNAALAAAPGDLVVVMFSGHGSELTQVEEREGGWIFSDGVLDVATLASKLKAEALADVEIVVISDTCWGHDQVVDGNPETGGVFFTALINELDGVWGSANRVPVQVFVWSALTLKRRTLADSAFARTLTETKSTYLQLKNRLQASCHVDLEQWGLICHPEIMNRVAFGTVPPVISTGTVTLRLIPQLLAWIRRTVRRVLLGLRLVNR